MKKIFVASDHAGFDLKNLIVNHFDNYFKHSQSVKSSFEIIDLGPQNNSSVDYPDFADVVCQKLKNNTNDYGILICGSGQGMAIRANKYSYIRAALIYNNDIAQLSREHNNANVICLGSRFCTAEDAYKWITTFINSEFSEGRHTQRVAKITKPVDT